ncbi:type II toxin-antitoxin system VapC family toxin [Paracoccus alkanivorans]|uniref:Type II toxin-antitoxin system VapC family toxin n=1 Tax=Paracoccus alkanivorans TaxID=2116655 RepID=A0A3M0MA34_9RHOB|nr:PIN domain-containing protein [Paracoccus alkanivorans]RMC34401.1 type II toxin-antitoxin system VapC family toxin [Paracoccus alkanivorans]
MNILVDTSVWVQHFRQRDDHLVQLLETDRVLIHPLIVAELACGTPPEPRERTLSSLRNLRKCNQATLDETMTFIERERLFGRGCGLVDLVLLASTLITEGTRLWTLDKRLASLANRFNVGYPAEHS